MYPTLDPGSVVFINIRHTVPTPDGIYAIRDRWGDVQVKRIETSKRRGDETIRIISDNGNRVETVGPDEIEIVGKVVGGLRRF